MLIFNFQNSIADETPEAVVNHLHESLIVVMKKSGELDFDARYRILEPVVLESFDFETISRLVLGRSWKKLNDDQKKQFIDILSRLSITSYVSRFDGYSGEKFEYLGDENMKKGRVLVKTQLITSERQIPFNYVLHPAADKWRIINVIADGISDLSLRRAEYTRTLKTDGFDKLVEKLLEKIKGMEEKGPDDTA